MQKPHKCRALATYSTMALVASPPPTQPQDSCARKQVMPVQVTRSDNSCMLRTAEQSTNKPTSTPVWLIQHTSYYLAVTYACASYALRVAATTHEATQALAYHNSAASLDSLCMLYRMLASAPKPPTQTPSGHTGPTCLQLGLQLLRLQALLLLLLPRRCCCCPCCQRHLPA